MKDQIRGIVQEFARGTVPEDTAVDLIESGIIDSLAIMSIFTALEDDFDIRIDGDDISKDNFQSVDTMAGLIEKCRK